MNLAQPALASRTSLDLPDDWRWVVARDGSLTARRIASAGEASDWRAGCSLPTLAAREQLRSLDGKAVSVCFIDPPHPAYLRLALDAGPANRVLFVVVPDASSLSLLLGAADLSADLARRRLWFAVGDAWADELRDVLTANPGLATPTQFIRLHLPDMARLDPVLADARRVLGEVAVDRSAQAAKWVADWSPAARPAGRICIVASRTWRPGDEAGAALASLASFATPVSERTREDPDSDEESGSSRSTAQTPASGLRHAQPDSRLFPDLLYADDPATGSTFELLRRAIRCDALLTADLARCDVPDLLPPAFPWITWVTTPRIPLVKLAGPNDRLLVVDPAWVDAAAKAGWARERVGIADYPSGVAWACTHARGNADMRAEEQTRAAEYRSPCHPHVTSEKEEDTGMSTCPCHPQPHVAVLADLCPTDPPESLEEFSSHRLLWESLRDEIRRDPFCVGVDAEAFVRSRLPRFDISADSIDFGLFIRGLIEPEVAASLVRRLVAEGVSIRVFGSGWDAAGFNAIWSGALTSRRHSADAARDAAALLDVRPAAWRNAMYSLGRPVIRTAGRTMLAVRQEIASAVSGRLVATEAFPRLTLNRVLDLHAVSRDAERSAGSH